MKTKGTIKTEWTVTCQHPGTDCFGNHTPSPEYNLPTQPGDEPIETQFSNTTAPEVCKCYPRRRTWPDGLTGVITITGKCPIHRATPSPEVCRCICHLSPGFYDASLIPNFCKHCKPPSKVELCNCQCACHDFSNDLYHGDKKYCCDKPHEQLHKPSPEVCKCSFPHNHGHKPTPANTNWQEEFDKKFKNKAVMHDSTQMEVKAFIADLLAKQKEDIWQLLRKKGSEGETLSGERVISMYEKDFNELNPVDRE